MREGNPKRTRAKPQRQHVDGESINGRDYVPKADDRMLVLLGAACGLTREQIARQVNWPTGISVKTLAKHFPQELEDGGNRANLQVAGRLFQTAITGRGKEATTSQIFWLKTRARWSERGPMQVDFNAAVQQGGDDDAPVSFTLRIGEREPNEGP